MVDITCLPQPQNDEYRHQGRVPSPKRRLFAPTEELSAQQDARRDSSASSEGTSCFSNAQSEVTGKGAFPAETPCGWCKGNTAAPGA